MRFVLPFKIFFNLFFRDSGLILALKDYALFKQLSKKKGEHIFIACFVKSGSTFIARVLSEITGYKQIYYSDFRGRADHDIYFPALLNVYDKDVIIQQHARATEMNLDYLNKDSSKVVVLVRNIFDALLSYRDHIINETINVPFIYCRDDFKEFPFETQMDMIVENVGPWFINFYVSWLEAVKDRKIDAVIIKYEDFIENPHEVLSRILNHYNLQFSSTFIGEKLQAVNNKKQKLRFNKGVIGRGEVLDDKLKSKVYSMIKYYHDIDFSPIGL